MLPMPTRPPFFNGLVGLEQHAVLHGLVPALDLALGLGMVRRAADLGDALAIEPPCEIPGDVGRSVVAEHLGRWRALSHPEAARASSRVSVTSPARMVVQCFQATM